MGSINPLDCFWACEYSLWYRHAKSKIAIFLFQYLHSQKYNGVAGLITNTIRVQLPTESPNNDKDVFNSKYISIVLITEMDYHQGVELFKIRNHSGHIIDTNQKMYLDQKTIELTLLGYY